MLSKNTTILDSGGKKVNVELICDHYIYVIAFPAKSTNLEHQVPKLILFLQQKLTCHT